jgi:Family of unknown function (DUF6221)
MDDLLAFLRERLDEDEQVAQAALDIDARVFAPPEFTVTYQWARMTRHQSGGRGTGFEPGAPSPARVLADVAAHRAIVDWIDGELADDATQQMPWDLACHLAAVHADHPDFREEWRP